MLSLFSFQKLQQLNLIQRQEIWTLTLKGWVVTFLFLMTITLISFFNLYPFLAVNDPISADALVIEGWLPDYAFQPALAEFKQGNYQKIITTGITLPKGYYLSEYKDFANLSAATFIKLGLDETKVVAVPTSKVIRNRTISTAITLQNWLETTDSNIKSINLCSLGPHARRSWISFRKYLSSDIPVGVISIPSREYNPDRWWLSSEGFRTCISEFLAYLYTLIFNLFK